MSYTKGDKVIVLTDEGYDIGYYDKCIYMDLVLVDYMSGRDKPEHCTKLTDVHPYSDALIDELSIKFGYEKRFSKIL